MACIEATRRTHRVRPDARVTCLIPHPRAPVNANQSTGCPEEIGFVLHDSPASAGASRPAAECCDGGVSESWVLRVADILSASWRGHPALASRPGGAWRPVSPRPFPGARQIGFVLHSPAPVEPAPDLIGGWPSPPNIFCGCLKLGSFRTFHSPAEHGPHDSRLCPHVPVPPSLASFRTIPSVCRLWRAEIGFVLRIWLPAPVRGRHLRIRNPESRASRPLLLDT
jgi:hypothetical protein